MSHPQVSTNGDSKKNVALMKAMGSKSGASDPIPPRQYEAFAEDERESPRLRVWSAILSRTIHGGPELERSHIAREPGTGRLTQQLNIAAELGLHKSQVSLCLSALEEEGRIKREGGKIMLCAEVPAPMEKAKKDRREVNRTMNLNEKEEEFLVHLQQLSETRFQAAAAALWVSEEWGMQLQADAVAWARQQKAEAREQTFTELGYTKTERRGATPKRVKTEAGALKPSISFPEFTAQRTLEIEKEGIRFTVQDGELTVYVEKKNTVQNSHPYRPEIQSSESQLANDDKGLNAKQAAPEAELKRVQLLAQLKNDINARLRKVKATALGAVKIDAGTLTTMAGDIARLNSAGAVAEVLDVLEERAREIQQGKRGEVGWGYLVKTVRGEVEKRLPADPRNQVRAAAAGKGIG